jgi:hypothetical protein
VAKLVASGVTELLHPEFGLDDKVSYVKLPKKFVAGTVVYGDVDEVATGVDVILTGDGDSRTVKTNGFGDFEFVDLAEAATYSVTIEVPGYAPATLPTRTSRDIYLGEVVLNKVRTQASTDAPLGETVQEK